MSSRLMPQPSVASASFFLNTYPSWRMPDWLANPVGACGPLNYKGCSLWPDSFSPLILPATALRWGGLGLLSLYPFDGPGD